MKTRIHYTSPKGSAEAVAEAIAREATQPKEPLPQAYMPEAVPLMFLGCEESNGKIDKVMQAFISTMDTKRVMHVALFTASPKGTHVTADAIKKVFDDKGIKVMSEILVTNGKGGFLQGGKQPTEEDLNKARAWAKKQIELVLDEDRA